MIIENPFSSEGFKSVWLKHFKSKDQPISFDCISNLDFVKHPKWPVHVNVGATLTKGIDYSLNEKAQCSLGGKTLIVYDVPTYFNINTSYLPEGFKFLKSKQYPGFLIDTENYKSLDEYMQDRFSKSSRNKNRKYLRRLETSFNISYKMWYGEITKDEHEYIYKAFKKLLEKRFTDKETINNNLDPKEWNFYYDVSYKLIHEKKASLFVVYDNDEPIGVTLCYFSEDILFDAITVFDIDYFKFHLGAVTIMKLIEWCTENGIKKLDFSKGYFEYKTRWCTLSYDFDYHIYYDSKSIKSKITAHTIKRFYDFKQTLREKNINERLHRFTYKLKNKKGEQQEKLKYNFEEIEQNKFQDEKVHLIKSEYDNELKLLLFEYLYLYQENYNNIKLYKVKSKDQSFIIEGKSTSVLATIDA